MAGLGGMVNSAKEAKLMSEEEGGFVLALVERFRQEIGRKNNQLMMLQGEMAQLRVNEKVIKDLLDNMLNAAKRDQDRINTAAAIRGHKESGAVERAGGVIEEPLEVEADIVEVPPNMETEDVKEEQSEVIS